MRNFGTTTGDRPSTLNAGFTSNIRNACLTVEKANLANHHIGTIKDRSVKIIWILAAGTVGQSHNHTNLFAVRWMKIASCIRWNIWGIICDTLSTSCNSRILLTN
jgi:hypothetical protein